MHVVIETHLLIFNAKRPFYVDEKVRIFKHETTLLLVMHDIK